MCFTDSLYPAPSMAINKPRADSDISFRAIYHIGCGGREGVNCFILHGLSVPLQSEFMMQPSGGGR